MSGEIRQNKATKEWVIFAPSRGKRPHDFQQAHDDREAVPLSAANCPFCPGNERILAELIEEQPGPDGAWQTRVVWNKYPALTPAASSARHTEGMYMWMEGYGHHEVIIESPRHNADLATMPPEQVAAVIETYSRRYGELRQDPNNMLILIFRNHGPRAGASLQHPHSQLIATGMLPHNTRHREEETQRYFDEWGRCVYCDMLQFEIAERKRVVLDNGSFVAFVPYAAEVPFETWILPKRHMADFAGITAAEKSDFAAALHAILRRLHEKLDDPDYNYTLNTSTVHADTPDLHWYLCIRPRLITRAGFEIGSGMRINPSLPEADAAFLNED